MLVQEELGAVRAGLAGLGIDTSVPVAPAPVVASLAAAGTPALAALPGESGRVSDSASPDARGVP